MPKLYHLEIRLETGEAYEWSSMTLAGCMGLVAVYEGLISEMYMTEEVGI